jgi:FHA domain
MFTLTWTISNLPIDKQPTAFLFEPQTDRFTIGRSATCDHQIQADGISRIHCTLVKNDEGWILVDGDGVKRSTYGIFYPNGERLPIAKMNPGQAIVLLNSSEHQIVLKSDRRASTPSDRDLTVGYEMSARVLTESLSDQTGQLEMRFELMMSEERKHNDSQLLKIRDFLEVVYDETKRLRTDFSVSTIDDGTRDKTIKEMRTIIKVLALILCSAGLWLAFKDQQTVSNIAGVIIMIGGAIGWGRSGKN